MKTAADMLANASDVDRFWSKVLIASPKECWLWQAGKDGRGYGAVWFRNRMVKAHRLSFAIANSVSFPSPEQVVRHDCDNPACVNPNHLSIGTQLDNIADMVGRSRHRAHGQTLCVRGHVLDGVHAAGRFCKICARAANRRWIARRREANRVEVANG